MIHLLKWDVIKGNWVCQFNTPYNNKVKGDINSPMTN